MLELIQNKLNQNLLLYLTRYGSHLFGVAQKNSDEDYKGLFLPPLKELVLQRAKSSLDFSSKPSSQGEKNSVGDIDANVYSLQYFFHLLTKSDTNMISILFSGSNPNAVIYQQPIFKQLLRDIEPKRLISRKLDGMTGYVKSQVYKYSLKGFKYSLLQDVLEVFQSFQKPQLTLQENLARANLDVIEVLEQRYQNKNFKELVANVSLPNPDGTLTSYLEVLGKKLNYREKVTRHLLILESLERSFGYRAKAASESNFADLKAIYHAFRVLHEVKELHTTGELHYPIANRDFLKEVRQGKYSMEELSEMLEAKLIEIEKVSVCSVLPEKIDKEYMDSLLLNTYSALGYNL